MKFTSGFRDRFVFVAVTLAIVIPVSVVSAQAEENAAKSPAVTTSTIKTGFPDVSGLHWAADSVAYLSRNGYMEGYTDGTFGGNKPLTRYEFAVSQSRIHIDRMEPDVSERARQTQITERLTALENRFKVLEEKLDAVLAATAQVAVQSARASAPVDRSISLEFKSLHSDLQILSELQEIQ